VLDDPKQQEAIARCCDVRQRVVAVTGKAGTGKTTIMRHVHEALTANGYTVVLAAPTGKAAKRIQEATGIAALTIHRLLEYTHPGERDEKTGKIIGYAYPKRDKRNPLPFDVVLADEYAMVNQEVHRNLFDALPPGGAIRVFGDVNQLAPIEPSSLADKPSPFTDLLARFQGIVLITNHRQNAGSGIAENGERILKGFCPSRRPDFEISISEEPVRLLEDYCMEMLMDGETNFASLDNQILTPSNKSWVGTLKLNAALQRVFQPFPDGWHYIPRHSWVTDKVRMRAGDKVIVTQNIYDLNLFNGETGIVTEITEYGEIAIDLGDRMVVVPPVLEVETKEGHIVIIDPRKDIDLAYAITTHKAQGSEYRRVIYVLNRSTWFVQTRANFYTAITRARHHVKLITDTRSFQHAVSTTRTVKDRERAKK
jgi:exodeoxyribonuclease V alpha subunit